MSASFSERFVKCNNCESIMLEHQISLGTDDFDSEEHCPYCSKPGCLMDIEDIPEIIDLISEWIQKQSKERGDAFETVSMALDAYFNL